MTLIATADRGAVVVCASPRRGRRLTARERDGEHDVALDRKRA